MDSSATDRIYFNTDVLPERDRFPAFCEGMFRHIIGADIAQIDSAPFSGALDIRRAGAVGIAHISITPARMTRRLNNVSDGNDAIVIQYWRHGSARLTQDECDNRIQAGDALIIDNAKPASLCAEFGVAVLVVDNSATQNRRLHAGDSSVRRNKIDQ